MGHRVRKLELKPQSLSLPRIEQCLTENAMQIYHYDYFLMPFCLLFPLSLGLLELNSASHIVGNQYYLLASSLLSFYFPLCISIGHIMSSNIGIAQLSLNLVLIGAFVWEETSHLLRHYSLSKATHLL